MSFADLEDRANAAVMRRLANATASFDGAEAVPAIFDEAYEVIDLASGIGSAGPAITVLTVNVPEDVVGTTVTVRDTAYTVVEPRPDGTGMSVLRLRLQEA